MSSVIFKTVLASKLVAFGPLLSILAFGLSILPALLLNRDQAQPSASSSPSRASGTPTFTTIYQETAPSWLSLPPISIIVTKKKKKIRMTEAATTTRRKTVRGMTMKIGMEMMVWRLQRHRHPTTPPPPPGGVEEDDDDDNSYSAFDGGLPWLFLLLLGKLTQGLFTRQKATAVAHVKPANVQLGTAKSATSASASSTIPGLLERQHRLVESDPTLETCAAPPPPTLIAGLLQRRPPPVPLPRVAPALARPDAPLPLLEQQAWDVPVPLATQSLAPVPRQGRLLPLWVWKTYLLLALLPGFAFVGTVARLLLALQPVIRIPEPERAPEAPLPEEQDEDGVPLPAPAPIQDVVPEPPPQEQEPAPPPPDPSHAAREKIRLALFQHKEFGDGDRVVRAQAVHVLQRTMARRAAGPALEEEDVDMKRRREVREVQRRLWRQLHELAARGEEEEL
ncbi:hypothetical protein B0H17DRAFT_1124125 [Mycena rosella]|uniref:Uncharacterized protein n=1 Tax=Mycena rosella TaxID=1033263 RepID=A0AAD7H0I6_MYCRO|nr:hypothetical protein B0H17DRAFT_1124125 [Mycena rosella]